MAKSNFDGIRFHNMDSEGNLIGDKFGYLAYWKWQLTRKSKPWPRKVKYKQYPKPEASSQDLKITYINHATFLIQINGINILTDPVYARGISPLKFFGPKRVHRPGVLFRHLPKIDYVLISHNHFDHMCIPTIKKLVKKHNPIFILGDGNARYIEKITYKFIQLRWDDSHKIAENLEFFFLRARHWSRRTPFDTNIALWGAFAIKSTTKNIYFAGDTGYGDHFVEAGQKFEKFDVALLPIGAYEPEYFMHEYHNNPSEAVQIHLDLNATVSIPMHFNTFKLSDEGIDEPLLKLNDELVKRGIPQNTFCVLEPGESKNC